MARTDYETVRKALCIARALGGFNERCRTDAWKAEQIKQRVLRVMHRVISGISIECRVASYKLNTSVEWRLMETGGICRTQQLV